MGGGVGEWQRENNACFLLPVRQRQLSRDKGTAEELAFKPPPTLARGQLSSQPAHTEGAVTTRHKRSEGRFSLAPPCPLLSGLRE